MESLKLQRCASENRGFSSEKLYDVFRVIEEQKFDVQSIMIYAKDAVILEANYAPNRSNVKHTLHSLTKVMANTAVGLLVGDGKLSLSDTVMQYFPEYEDVNNDPRLRRMTIKDLITMRNGHGRMISGNEWRPIKKEWTRKFFEEPMVYEPGTVFQYSSANSYILSAIVQKLTGNKTSDFLKRRIFDPMGIIDYTWDVSPDGVNPGGNGLSLTVEDMLKIGVLYLHKGKWEGKSLIDAAWVNASLGKRTQEERGYGYHWDDIEIGWMATGAFGQIICIIPSLDVAIAVTAGSNQSMEKLMKAVYDVLMNAMCKPTTNEGETINVVFDHVLIAERNKTLADGSFKAEANVDGIIEFGWKTEGEKITFVLKDARGIHTLACGLRTPIETITDMTGHYLHHQYDFDEMPCAAIARIPEDNEFEMEWYFLNTPFHDDVRIVVANDIAHYTRKTNVNSQSLERPVVIGKAIR